MNNIITVNYEEKPVYDITLEYNYNMLYKELDKLGTSKKKICVVTDSNLSRHYLNELIELLKDYAKVVETFTFPAGETSKNLETVQELYNRLIQSNFDRKDLLVALGGGVVGDLTGYAAATYLRGIQFIQLPTSLLAMVDSSIGGKTGVDFQDYKNMVGAFHQPAAVYMNLSTLYSLSDVQFFSGLGEIIKHGLIKESSYYLWLKENIDSIKKREPDSLREMVFRSCKIKQEVVEKDPKEQGERALLNFGHTIGHAVEKLMDFKLLHGECVAVGMVAASYLSYKKNWITLEELEDIKTVLKAFELPISISGLDPNEIYRVTTHDKKVEGNKIKFILLRRIGEAYIDIEVTPAEIIESIEYILED
jgi:3-dehydroquinate synthase